MLSKSGCGRVVMDVVVGGRSCFLLPRDPDVFLLASLPQSLPHFQSSSCHSTSPTTTEHPQPRERCPSPATSHLPIPIHLLGKAIDDGGLGAAVVAELHNLRSAQNSQSAELQSRPSTTSRHSCHSVHQYNTRWHCRCCCFCFCC